MLCFGGEAGTPEHMSHDAYDYLYLTADELPLTFGGLLPGM